MHLKVALNNGDSRTDQGSAAADGDLLRRAGGQQRLSHRQRRDQRKITKTTNVLSIVARCRFFRRKSLCNVRALGPKFEISARQ
jgi:hypothetical protein